jgi:Ran GTPase-activating protein (RanGAP) involved in mRNA processing and transport
MKSIFLLILVFLQNPSLAVAMHSRPEFKFTGSRLELSRMSLGAQELSRLLQSNDFKNLKELNISHSKIDPKLFRKLPADLEKLSLKSVTDLQGKTLSIDQFLKNTLHFNDLKALSLRNQNIYGKFNFINIFQEKRFNNIKELNISYSKIDPKLFSALSTNLEKLSLNSVTDLDGNMLSSHHFLENTPYFNHLKVLSLENQHITNSQLFMMTEMQGLQKLTLPNNQITAEGFMKVVTIQGLEVLDLRDNQVGSFDSSMFTQASNIKRLIFKRNRINSKDAFFIAQMKKIKYLDLSENQIGDIGAKHIAFMQGIESLNLNHNQIGEDGAHSLSRMRGIRFLHLDFNQIGHQGADYIAQMQGIRHLNLKSNQIGDIGARYISKMVEISSLDLTSNQIGKAGALDLSSMQGVKSLNLNL